VMPVAMPFLEHNTGITDALRVLYAYSGAFVPNNAGESPLPDVETSGFLVPAPRTHGCHVRRTGGPFGHLEAVTSSRPPRRPLVDSDAHERNPLHGKEGTAWSCSW
jgi:hypothetical protein